MDNSKELFKNLDLTNQHLCLLYENYTEWKSVVANFIITAIEKNEKCLCIIEESSINLIKEYLSNQKQEIDFVEIEKKGQLVYLNVEEYYTQHKIINPSNTIKFLKKESHQAVNEGYQSLKVTREITALLEEKYGTNKIIEYENELKQNPINELPLTLFCKYNTQKISPNLLQAVMEIHSHLVYDYNLHENPYYIPIQKLKTKNKVERQVKAWLYNINTFSKAKNKFKEDLESSYQQLETYNQSLEKVTEELDKSFYKMNELASNFEKMIELTADLNKESFHQEEKFLSKLLNTAINIIPEADYGLIYTLEDNKVNFKDAIGYNLNKLNSLPVDREVFHSVSQEVITTDKLIKDNQETKLTKLLDQNKELMTIGLYIDQEEIGGLSLSIAKGNSESFGQNSKRLIKAFSNIANSFFTLQRYSEVQNEFQREIITSITQMLEIHDRYTKGHSQNVAKIAEKVAMEMKLDNNQIKDAYWAGIVHDIGKTIVPGRILNKKGDLTDEEYEEIKKHPRWGYLTLKNSQKLKKIGEYVLAHHERWDGKGYPQGLKEEEIPLISQIITLADAWDAMCSDRSYRNRLPRNIALKEIRNNSAKQFSPQVVEAFINLLQKKKLSS